MIVPPGLRTGACRRRTAPTQNTVPSVFTMHVTTVAPIHRVERPRPVCRDAPLGLDPWRFHGAVGPQPAVAR